MSNCCCGHCGYLKDLPWYDKSLEDKQLAFELMEEHQRNQQQSGIQIALREYNEYRATINPPENEPVPTWKLLTDRLTELLS